MENQFRQRHWIEMDADDAASQRCRHRNEEHSDVVLMKSKQFIMNETQEAAETHHIHIHRLLLINWNQYNDLLDWPLYSSISMLNFDISHKSVA